MNFSNHAKDKFGISLEIFNQFLINRKVVIKAELGQNNNVIYPKKLSPYETDFTVAIFKTPQISKHFSLNILFQLNSE